MQTPSDNCINNFPDSKRSYNFDQMTANLNGIKVDDLINEKVNKSLNQIILKDILYI